MHWTYTTPPKVRHIPRLVIIHVVSHSIHLYRIYLVLLALCLWRLFPKFGIQTCISTGIACMLLTQMVVMEEISMGIMTHLSLRDLRTS